MKFFRQFTVKIALLFLLLLLLMGIALAFFTMRITDSRQIEIDQIVNWNLATDMAGEIAPMLEEYSSPADIEPAIHYMMVLNPAIEVYVLDREGNILAYFVEPGDALARTQVSLDPILDFINNRRKPPLFGDDPRNIERQKHFSAAEISFSQNRKGYLYIVLQSTIYDMAADMLQERILSRALARALLLSLVFVGLMGLVLFSLLTRRLKQLIRSVKAFEDGDLSRRTSFRSRDEIGKLAAAFNGMAETISANLEALKQNDQLRRELVANVSHDLRNPLTSIQGFVETLLIKQDTLEGAEVKRYLEIILNEVTRLNKLVHELFELSKLEAKENTPAPEVFSLTELIQDIKVSCDAIAGKRGVELNASLPQTLFLVHADVHMIERVLSNLIDNAIKFAAPEHGRVLIGAEEQNGHIRVRVTDNGAGIPENEITHIFDRFYTSDKTRSRRVAGSGLGLSIAAKILELHDAELSVESVAGKGSTFSFSLPLVVC
ncbi:MAG: two-component sensor histidine kinase [Spirochaetales bacterium]|nr:two-component sensor histidine kinase [Spirochaetales bacterium]